MLYCPKARVTRWNIPTAAERQSRSSPANPVLAQAGYDVLARGGNACDAAVATLLALNVTHFEAASFPGVVPTLYYNASTGEVKSYIGAGKAPAAATMVAFRSKRV